MSTPFTLSKGRFEAFSDGVFAIAITLLVLEFHLPNFNSPPSSWEQLQTLVGIWPQYVVYVASFLTIGIMWLNHHAQFRFVEKITHGIVIANLVLLLFISFLPFPTEVLAKFGLTNVAVTYYGLVLCAIAVAYNLLHWQIVASDSSIPRTPLAWSVVGLTAYPVATAIAYFSPFAGVALFTLLAIFYMLPSNVSSAAFRPE
ncbi:MAG TPA: TMEM175 family protein [Candidatus Eremiobacteraceae bacterium]|nr:TMEM175 family protein [Candidatus Eremiobacteraceae bacterium]